MLAPHGKPAAASVCHKEADEQLSHPTHATGRASASATRLRSLAGCPSPASPVDKVAEALATACTPSAASPRWKQLASPCAQGPEGTSTPRRAPAACQTPLSRALLSGRFVASPLAAGPCTVATVPPEEAGEEPSTPRMRALRLPEAKGAVPPEEPLHEPLSPPSGPLLGLFDRELGCSGSRDSMQGDLAISRMRQRDEVDDGSPTPEPPPRPGPDALEGADIRLSRALHGGAGSGVRLAAIDLPSGLAIVNKMEPEQEAGNVSGGNVGHDRGDQPGAGRFLRLGWLVNSAPTEGGAANVSVDLCEDLQGGLEEPRRHGKGAGKGPCAPPPPRVTAKGTGPGKARGKGLPPPMKAASLGKASEPRKPDVRPTVNVKKLYWSSFRFRQPPEACDGTVWATPELEEVQIDTAQLERFFAEDPSGSRAPSAQAEKEKQGPRLRRIQVLCQQRRRQICVMTARLPALETVREAILSLDFTQLSREQVELLSMNLPSQEEVQLLRQAESQQALDEHSAWDTAEEFLFMLLGVPHFKLRLQLWDFENGFQEHAGSLAARQREVLEACDCVLASRGLRRLLGLVLAVGNHLNGGTPRGRADGFSVETLAQVRMLKMAPQAGATGTLVDYLARQMEAQFPGELEELFAAGKEVEKIRRASRPKLEELSEELRSLTLRAEKYLQMVRATGKGLEAAQEEVFLQHGELLAMCVAELEELRSRQGLLARRYEELRRFFRVEEKACDEFFGAWDAFLQELEKSCAALRAQEKEEARRSRSFSAGQRSGAPAAEGAAVAAAPSRRRHRRAFSAGPRRSGARLAHPEQVPMQVAPLVAAELARLSAVKAAREYLEKLATTCANSVALGDALALS